MSRLTAKVPLLGIRAAFATGPFDVVFVVIVVLLWVAKNYYSLSPYFGRFTVKFIADDQQ